MRSVVVLLILPRILLCPMLCAGASETSCDKTDLSCEAHQVTTDCRNCDPCRDEAPCPDHDGCQSGCVCNGLLSPSESRDAAFSAADLPTWLHASDTLASLSAHAALDRWERELAIGPLSGLAIRLSLASLLL